MHKRKTIIQKALTITLLIVMVMDMATVPTYANDTVGNDTVIKDECTCKSKCDEGNITGDCNICKDNFKNCEFFEESAAVVPYEKLVQMIQKLPSSESITVETTDEEKELINSQLKEALSIYESLEDELKSKFKQEYADLFAKKTDLQDKLTIPSKAEVASVTTFDIQVKTFDELKTAIANAPKDGTSYVIEVTADFDITASLIIRDKKNILIRGNSSERMLKRGVNDVYLFNVTVGATLILEDIIIDGNKSEYTVNKIPLLVVQQGATLNLSSGTVVQNNIAFNSTQGGGVYIAGNKTNLVTFSMDNAIIKNNEAKNGGGICIKIDGGVNNDIKIKDSVISNNEVTNGGGAILNETTSEIILDNSQIIENKAAGNGAGIYSSVDSTISIINGSCINNNIGGTVAGNFSGGAIYANKNIILFMDNGKINNNENQSSNTGYGGALYCGTGTISLNNNSQINNNETSSYGGAIYSPKLTKLEMDGGSEISGNTATKADGGGICSGLGFSMIVKGASKINDNTAGGYGGGIAVVSKNFPEGTAVSFEDTSEIVGNSAKSAGAMWLGNIDNANLYSFNISGEVKVEENVAENTGAIYIRGAKATISTTSPIHNNKNTIPDQGASVINLAYGTLTLKNGVNITDNSGGIPVLVTNDSTLTMEGGSAVTDNISDNGSGGIYLKVRCNLNMQKGSKISGNVVRDGGGGGGIYLYGSSGTIAGEVSNNSAADSGGGIYIHGHTKDNQPDDGVKVYIIDGAQIKGNTAALSGGGIYVNGPKTNEDIDPRAVLYVQGGQITENTANGTGNWVGLDYGGGGIGVDRGQAEIYGGDIINNTAKKGAGGIQVNAQNVLFSGGPFIGSGKLKIAGGNVSGNTSVDNKDRTAMGIEGVNNAIITISTKFSNKQSLRVDTKSSLIVEDGAALNTIGNVTIGNTTVDPNGGTVKEMKNFVTNSIITMPPESVKEALEFGGWYDGTTIYEIDKNVNASGTKVYKAVWKYQVTYETGSNADNGQKNILTNKYTDISLKLLGKTFNRVGYTQIGWSTSDGSEKTHDFESEIVKDEELVLYPAWKANEYTLSFNENGGNELDIADKSIKVTYDSKYPKLVLPSRTGHAFKEWNTKQDGSGTKIMSGNMVAIPANTEVFAQWEKNKYNVTFQYNDGTSVDSTTSIEYGDTVTFQRPEYKGFGFLGWKYGSELIQVGDIFTVPAKNVTFIAQWIKTGGVDVSVEDEIGNPVKGAKVEIMQASKPVLNGSERTSNSKGKVKFTELPYGIYNIVVTYKNLNNDITVTKEIYIYNPTQSISIILPKIRLNTEVTGTVPVVVENLESAISEEEKNLIADGNQPGSVIEINLKLNSEDEKDTAIQKAMDKVAGPEKKLTNYFDITITKTVRKIMDNGQEILGSPEEIKNTANFQTIYFELTKELNEVIETQENTTIENVVVYRRHIEDNGKVNIEQLHKVSEDRGKIAGYDCYYIVVVHGKPYIAIRAKKFSTYAFGHQTKQVEIHTSSLVTFDANGGTVNTSSILTNLNNQLEVIPNPSRDKNYRFDGWFTSAIGGIKIDSTTVFNTDSTVYAHWTYVEPTETFYTITTKLNKGGTISSGNIVYVKEREDFNFIITPDKGYIIGDVIVDGKSVGRVEKFSFKNVIENHTIEVVFKLEDKKTPSTGDHTNTEAWYSLLFASGMTLLIIMICNKKRNKQRNI